MATNDEDWRKEIRRQIAFANKVVSQWPAWKRNILAHSSQPTNSIARRAQWNEV